MKTNVVKLTMAAVMVAAGIMGCKPRMDDGSSTRSFQSLHKGGKTLLWYGSGNDIYLCVLDAPLTDVNSIESLDQYKTLCKGGKEARISKREFASMSSEFFANSTFKSLIRGQEIVDAYTQYANRATKEKDLIVQTSAVALVMNQLEVVEYQLSKSKAEFNSMESFLAQAGTNGARPNDSEIREIYGDTYQKVKTLVDELEKKKPTLEKSIETSAQTLSAAMTDMIKLRERFEGRINTLMDEIFAKELKKTSLLTQNSIDYAIFTNAAVQLGVLDGAESGVLQTSANTDLAKIKCEAAKGDAGKFQMKGPAGQVFGEFASEKNCRDMIVSYRSSGVFCSDVVPAIFQPKGGSIASAVLGDPFGSFELCSIAVQGATKNHACAPYANSFNSSAPGLYAWSLIDQSKGDKFENSAEGLKSCAEHISRLAKVEVASAFFRNAYFSTIVKLPSGTNAPGSGQPVANNNSNSNNNSGNNQPAVQPQPATPSGPSVTPVPESLPAESELAVDDIVSAMKAIKARFKVDDGTRDACLQATQSASLSTWSDIMAHYYCQYPVYDNNTASVRACFTGTLRGQGGYAQKTDYRQAFDQCINRFEFDWVRTDNLMQFQYIMMSQRDLTGKIRFSKSSQLEALEKFYGSASAIPVRKP